MRAVFPTTVGAFACLALLGSSLTFPNLAEMMVELRIALFPDGSTTGIDVGRADQPSNAETSKLAESVIGAVMISSPLQLPPGISISSINVRFHPGEVMQ